MKPKSSYAKSPAKAPAEQVVKDIRRADPAPAVRRRGQDPRRAGRPARRGQHRRAVPSSEGIAQSLYYTWSKEFLEAGKRRLAGDTTRAATTGEVQDLRQRSSRPEGRSWPTAGARELRLAEKKHGRGWGRRGMRYPASEKLEIIRIVEQSHLPARKRTLEQTRRCPPDLLPLVRPLPRRRPRGAAGSASGGLSRVWNRIPADVRDQIVELALERAGVVAPRAGRALHRRRSATSCRKPRSTGCSRPTI